MHTPDNRPEEFPSAAAFSPKGTSRLLKRVPFAIRFAVVALMLPATLPAQSPNAEANHAWSQLTALAAPPPKRAATKGNAGTADSSQRSQAMARLRAAASAARAFQEKYPDDLRSAEARQIETKVALLEAMAGDQAQAVRASALVAQVRADTRLPAGLRFEVTALAEIVRLRALAGNRAAFLAGHEQVARALIAEFPAEAGGYEALLRLANNHPDDAESLRVATEIEGMPAPARVKAAASALRERHALVGRLLAEIVGNADDGGLVTAAGGHGVILYSWSSDQATSIAMAKGLVRLAPAGARFIGINGDADPVAARAKAAAEGLPGDQVCDPAGFGGAFARALKLERAGEVYVTAPDGKLTSVTARHGNLTAKFNPARAAAQSEGSGP